MASETFARGAFLANAYMPHLPRDTREGYILGGVFGIHKDKGRASPWRVTHLASGYALDDLAGRTLADARRRASEALALPVDWTQGSREGPARESLEAICGEHGELDPRGLYDAIRNIGRRFPA